MAGTNSSAASLDATIGIGHERKDNPIPLIYDLMEPLHPLVDRAVLEFALCQTFTPGDFTINKWGGCRLNPQVARAVVKRVSGIDGKAVISKLVSMLQQRNRLEIIGAVLCCLRLVFSNRQVLNIPAAGITPLHCCVSAHSTVCGWRYA